MIKPYHPKYQNDLIQIIRSNTPKFFAPAEEKDFIDYLENEVEGYFVVIKDEKVIGSGGINFFEEQELAKFSWGLIHPDFHRMGIGKELLSFRINEIKKNSKIKTIQVRTSQVVFEFYKKYGFELEKIEEDFWAEGLHLYQMNMKITPKELV